MNRGEERSRCPRARSFHSERTSERLTLNARRLPLSDREPESKTGALVLAWGSKENMSRCLLERNFAEKKRQCRTASQTQHHCCRKQKKAKTNVKSYPSNHCFFAVPCSLSSKRSLHISPEMFICRSSQRAFKPQTDVFLTTMSL